MKLPIAIAVILCFCLSASIASTPAFDPPIAEHLITERLSTLNSQIDIRLTDITKKKIEEYVNYKLGAEKLITKSKIYFPVFEEQLRKYNIPEEFKYLPIVESHLRVSIKSRAGAVGLWQFMKRTGQSFGLQIGAEVDERMDVTKSSEAAAQYLLQLYHEFQDWTLVLAAYNAGAGGVRKAIRKSGHRDYWKMYEYLPRETRSYIPKFAAVAYLMNFHQAHDIDALVPTYTMDGIMSAKVFHEIDFTTIAQSSETPIEIIEALNAQYFKGFIPDNKGEYLLKLPAEYMNEFLSNNKSARVDLATLPAGYRNQKIKVRELNSSIKDFMNSMQNKNELQVIKPVAKDYKLIRLKKRETLASIAMKAGVSLDKIIALNNLDSGKDVSFQKFYKIPTSID